MRTIDRAALGALLLVLQDRGYQIIGPTLRDGAIVYGQITRTEDLPVGWTDHQDGGSYRLARRPDEALFGYAVGPQSLKNYFFSPRQKLWQATINGGRLQDVESATETRRRAFVGVRSCDLHAVEIQDKVFLGGQVVDSSYAARRLDTFVIAVNCGQAASTCFCTSMKTGPKATRGFDLALTEVLNDAGHYFVVEIGSDLGDELLNQIPYRESTEQDVRSARAVQDRAAAEIRRTVDTRGLKELLYSNNGHPRWEEVASRCLTCANCTMVCPTCFCTTVEDVPDLAGQHVERWRTWDSCFTMDFSYIHGGSVRASAKSRYRQWMTHKLASWVDQFGSSGCVGCGRCITWCPVGIDLTEEVQAIRTSEGRRHQPTAQEQIHANT